tara:strand:+ start:496 stop:819 length:324 start_codon:yes stop_codon:yes gene_type:complete
MKVLEISGKVRDIIINNHNNNNNNNNNLIFSKLLDVNVKTKGSPHLFEAELGVVDERWALKATKIYKKIEFEELFGFDNKCLDEKVVDISEANLKLCNKVLGEPLNI